MIALNTTQAGGVTVNDAYGVPRAAHRRQIDQRNTADAKCPAVSGDLP